MENTLIDRQDEDGRTLSPHFADPADKTAVAEQFIIDDEGKADWLLSKLASIRAEQSRIKAQAAKRSDELEADYNRLYGRFGEQLEQWARQEAERRRRRSVTLLNGTVSFRAVPARYIVTDYQDAIQTALLIAPDAVQTLEIPARVETKLDDKALMAAVKIAYDAAKEIEGFSLPGIALSEAKESVKVAFGKDSE